MSHSRAYASALPWSRLPTASSSTLSDACAPGMTLRLMFAVETMPPFTGVMRRTIAHVSEIGIGMLGYAFMGKAHSNAFRKIAYMTWPPPLEPRLVGIAGRNEAGGGEARE